MHQSAMRYFTPSLTDAHAGFYERFCHLTLETRRSPFRALGTGTYWTARARYRVSGNYTSALPPEGRPGEGSRLDFVIRPTNPFHVSILVSLIAALWQIIVQVRGKMRPVIPAIDPAIGISISISEIASARRYDHISDDHSICVWRGR